MIVLRSRRAQRRGTILVLFAFLVFALMALAALAVDMGILINTQRQMQSAVDTAALEGLRFRDEAMPSAAASSPPSTDPQQLDAARRQAAAQLVLLRFTDPANQIQFGAGPVLNYSGGVTQAAALQTVSVPAQHTYIPDLQSNLTNQVNGDMVSGTFTFVPDSRAVEASDYSRLDFNVASAPTPSAVAPSFLVRTRRTGVPTAADNEPDVSSSGPGVPLLFARGSLIGPAPNSSYNPRSNGLTARGTAIADGSPVILLGSPLNADPANNFAGVRQRTAFVLLYSSWTVPNSATYFPGNGQRTNVALAQNGNILFGSQSGTSVGFFHNLPSGPTALTQPVLAAGALPSNLALPAPGSTQEQQRLDVYVPLVNSLTNPTIAGFGYASMTLDPSTNQVQILKQGGALASQNTSTNVVALPNSVNVSAVIPLMQTLQTVRAEVLLAPILAR